MGSNDFFCGVVVHDRFNVVTSAANLIDKAVEQLAACYFDCAAILPHMAVKRPGHVAPTDYLAPRPLRAREAVCGA